MSARPVVMSAHTAWTLLLDCMAEQPLFTTEELYPQFSLKGYRGCRREFEQLRRRALAELVRDGWPMPVEVRA